jgi:autophagy-related protein 9
MAYPYADRYLDQFPKDKTAQIAKFVVFVAGALGGVLGLISMFDTELFLGFEIEGRTVLFWLGALGAIWKVARGAVPNDEMVQEPEAWLGHVIEYTHYFPTSWENRLNTDEVRQEFASLYKLEIIMFLEEIASVILTPLIFIFSMPNCAEQIVDFFREFTIHVDGLGHVCSFAIFDFNLRNGQKAAQPAPASDLRADFYNTRDNKLSQSVLFFNETYAGVPKKGLSRPRPFNLPPAFPGMGSTHSGPAPMRGSRFASPAIMAHAGPPSPQHSVLLDSHHQPRPSPRQAPQSRYRSTSSRQHAFDEHAEDPGRLQRTNTKILEEPSGFGDTWAVRGDAGMNMHDDGGPSAEGTNVISLVANLISKGTRTGRP